MIIHTSLCIQYKKKNTEIDETLKFEDNWSVIDSTWVREKKRGEDPIIQQREWGLSEKRANS